MRIYFIFNVQHVHMELHCSGTCRPGSGREAWCSGGPRRALMSSRGRVAFSWCRHCEVRGGGLSKRTRGSPRPCQLTVCRFPRSTLVVKQKLPGVYVQPSYHSALSKTRIHSVCSTLGCSEPNPDPVSICSCSVVWSDLHTAWTLPGRRVQVYSLHP